MTLTAASIAALALIPAAASAATTAQSSNASTDLSALTAYHTYLSSLTADASSAAARDTQILDGVTNTCSDVLADLNKLSAGQLKKSALTAFGSEVDAGLDLAYISAGTAALNRFATALDGLSWSTTSQFNTTMTLIAGERALLDTTPPRLCPDAIALDAAPLSEPTTTRHFLSRYHRASSALNSDLSAFQALLTKFETKSEGKLVAQINALVSGYSSQSTSTEQSDADAVLSELGVNT